MRRGHDFPPHLIQARLSGRHNACYLTSCLRTAIVSSIIVFGHATAHAMHTCKSERAHPSAIIFLDNNIANNDIVMMMTKLMITKRNERMEPKSQNLSITSSSEIFYTSC